MNLSELPDDVKALIVRNAAATNIACDLLEQFTGRSSAQWGATVSIVARKIVEPFSEEDRAQILQLIEEGDRAAKSNNN